MHINIQSVIKAVSGVANLPIQLEDLFIERVSIDSRHIARNSLFIPLKGERFDGHDFVKDALKKGAVCLSEKWIRTEQGEVLIIVESARKALMDLAAYYLSTKNVKVVGITGSTGKTTTKDLIASVLSQKYKVSKTIGNYNNDIGLPLTIFDLQEDCEVLVLEMGMSHFHEIHQLSKIARPDVCVITNIGVAHIENFKNRRDILKAKCEIFDYMKKDGFVVLNGADDLLITLKNNFKNEIYFGFTEDNHVYAESIYKRGLEGIDFFAKTPAGNFMIEMNMPGRHIVLDAMAAVCCGIIFNVPAESIQAGVKKFHPTHMRLQIEKTKNGMQIINDAYNANPDSTRAAIDVLMEAKGRKIAILGDMLELGKNAETFHFQLGRYIKDKNLFGVVCIGKMAAYIFEGLQDDNQCNFVVKYKTKEEFFARISNTFKKGDVCLVKASRGMHFEEIIEKLHEVD